MTELSFEYELRHRGKFVLSIIYQYCHMGHHIRKMNKEFPI